MTLKIGVQMDHISSIDIKSDSTFALSMEAQTRGYELFHYTPDRLQFRGGKVSAAIEPMQLRNREGNHFSLGEPVATDLTELDVILLRQDPPFDMAYITTTYLLERIQPETLIVNNPISVRNAPEKILVMDFPDLMPETLVTCDIAAIIKFREEFGDIILKPLYGNGGSGVFHIARNDHNFSSLLEMFDTVFREPFIVQRYLPAVRAGDKRIILVDGKPVGALNRIPTEGDVRSNMHVGGRAEHTQLTPRDHEICERIAPAMRKHGFILVGIDIIGDYITEINVTSPTGIQEIRNLSGIDIAPFVWDAIIEHL